MGSGSSRAARALVLGLLLATAVVVWWGTRQRTAPKVQSPQVAAARPSPKAARPGIPSWDDADGGAANDAARRAVPPDDPLPQDPLAGVDERASAWAKVDLEEIRKAMPDNLYWKMAAPTTDPEVQREREAERARWNVEYGKVLSNTATPEEIDAYYAHQQRLSTDYLEFLVYLRDHYAEVIPKEDVGLLKLAGELHLARLEEIPHKIAEAHERRGAHEAVRRAWLEEQKAFEDAPSGAE